MSQPPRDSPAALAALFQGLLSAQQAGLPLGAVLPKPCARADHDWIRQAELQGLWGRRFSQQLRLAQDHGQLEALLRSLATSMRDRAQILYRWRSGLSLPLAAMLLATLLAPLPALFGGPANWTAYCLHAFSLWVSLLVGIRLTRWVWLAPAASRWRARLAALCPSRRCTGLGWQHRLRLEAMQQFTLAYSAGLPISEAAASAAKLCPQPKLAEQWRRLSTGLAAGANLGDMLPALSLVDSKQQQWILTAEAAGRLDQALWQSVAHSQAQILDQALAWATWCSRGLLLLGPTATYMSLQFALNS